MIIHTNRLTLRPLIDADESFFHEMNMDKDVMRYFPNICNLEEDTIYWNNFRKKPYAFAITTKKSNEFIGMVFLSVPKDNVPFAGETEIGWRLRKQFWRRGYATEAADALFDYAFDELNHHVIYAYTTHNNAESINVMKKLGMTYQYNFMLNILKDTPLNPCVVYKIEK
ncbi:MAG: GNAT family N-acetyltransferase [Alphaproteobacteria bacterium]